MNLIFLFSLHFCECAVEKHNFIFFTGGGWVSTTINFFKLFFDLPLKKKLRLNPVGNSNPGFCLEMTDILNVQYCNGDKQSNVVSTQLSAKFVLYLFLVDDCVLL